MTLVLVSPMQPRSGVLQFETPKLSSRFNGAACFIEIDPDDLLDPLKGFTLTLASTDDPPGQDNYRNDFIMTWQGGGEVRPGQDPPTGVNLVIGDDGTSRRLRITISINGTLTAALWVDE